MNFLRKIRLFYYKKRLQKKLNYAEGMIISIQKVLHKLDEELQQEVDYKTLLRYKRDTDDLNMGLKWMINGKELIQSLLLADSKENALLITKEFELLMLKMESYMRGK